MRQGVGHLAVIAAALAAWRGADLLQASVSEPALWGLLDLVAHAAVAIFCVAWLVPSWGWTPVIWATFAATAIDVDHVFTARLVGTRLASLGARSPLHSLAGILLLTGAAGWLTNQRVALATGVGLVTHLCRDASEVPGVPLWAPVSMTQDVMVPTWTLPALVVVLSVSAALVAGVIAPAAGLTRRRAPPRP